MCFDKKMEIEEWTLEEARWKSGNQLFERRELYRTYYYYFEDILRVIMGYPNVEFRFIIIPTTDLPSMFFPIFATREQIEYQLDLGEKDAEEMLMKYLNITRRQLKNGTLYNLTHYDTEQTWHANNRFI